MFKKIVKFLLGLIPKDEKLVVFESHSDFTDNSKALYDYMRKNIKGYKYIWLVDHPENFENTDDTTFIDIKKVNKSHFSNVLKIVRAKYIFYTHREISFQNSKKQIVVNLTHGIGIKDAKGKLPTDYTYVIGGSTKLNDLSMYVHEAKLEQIIPLGYPRNDILFESNENVNKLRKDAEKLILWLPTFRKHKNGNIDSTSNLDGCTFPLFKDTELKELNEKLKEYNYMLILKLHPAQFIDESKNKDLNFSNIKIMTNDDLAKLEIPFYSLLANSDAILTDYSSVGTDYMLLNRPIGYVLDDVEEFKSKRGFYFENYTDYMPGDKIFTKDDFYKFIDDIKSGKDEYALKRKEVRDFFWEYSDNKNTERLLKWLKLI